MAAGGFNGLSVSLLVEIFDPETGVWEKGESMVEAKSGMASVMVERGMVSEEVLEAVFGKRKGLMEETIERRRRRNMGMCWDKEECDCSQEKEEKLYSSEFDDEDENESSEDD